MKMDDRIGPAEVPAVHLEKIDYIAINNGRSLGLDQDGGIIGARAPDTGELLWTIQVYQCVYDPARETDLQEVYITSLSLGKFPNTLEICNEEGHSFILDLATKKITALR
ncbi:MAG: hypothetical protein L3J28_02495 [Candidatus Polarisedimenticolaceae bacterium]|nr:hypothetical protein [Candidatus Polarisedimenticolaceae bacterium]